MPAAETPEFIRTWLETVPRVTFSRVVPDPSRTAVFSADVINGFFRFGPLASSRVNALTSPILDLVTLAHEAGVARFFLLQDTHDPATPEFNSYPSHCLAGTAESEMIPELANLPFADLLTVIPKNSLNPAIETDFDDWWDANRDIRTALVVGDCTDLCVYQLAMHLRMRANALNLPNFSVVVATNVVDTFDIPDEPALAPAPGSAHPGDFFHDVFLYHMAQNGVRVVREITRDNPTT